MKQTIDRSKVLRAGEQAARCRNRLSVITWARCSSIIRINGERLANLASIGLLASPSPQALMQSRLLGPS